MGARISDLKDLNLDEQVQEATQRGESEIMEMKAKDAYVKNPVEQ